MQDFINGKKQKESGFTIIEVVLVLAIAGLIFLIVFLALPQLQRSRRDTQRRGDAGKILSSAESAASNQGGVYPTASNLNTDYVSGKITAPGGGAYTLAADLATLNAATTSADTYFYATNSACSSSTGEFETNATTYDARDIAVAMRLEEGTFCQDNQ